MIFGFIIRNRNENHSLLMLCMNCVLPAGVKSQVEDTFVF